MRTPPELEWLLNTSQSLYPFPFHTSQYSLYTNMVPARLVICDHKTENLENKYVPKANVNSEFCGIVYSDEQLVRKCRSRSKGGSRILQRKEQLKLVQNVQCPDPGVIGVDEELGKKIHKYVQRSEALHCQTHKGMWNEEMSNVHKCVLITVGHLLGFKPGDLVLDWGSGCGHKLTWAKQLFDVDGLGLDIMGAAVSWAQEHSIGSFCHADGRNLTWVPDSTFDHVISYAAIYHLSKADQCRAGLQLVGKLKVGGKAWLGWNHGPVMSNWEWRHCFREAFMGYLDQADPIYQMSTGREVEIEALEEGFLFPPDANLVAGKGTFLYQYPAYSLLLTRLS